MAMRWERLLFMHWPVPADALRPHVPDALEIETCDGTAWLGIVPFTMAGVRARCTPAVPGLSAFHELNVRTYVRHGDFAGVWFFGLDAAHRLGVEAARRVFHLNYLMAAMRLSERAGAIEYRSTRTDARGGPAELDVRYAPMGEPRPAAPGSLEAFLTDRYRLFASDLTPREHPRVWKGEIDHGPWPLAPAECEIRANTMADPIGVPLPGTPPLLHYAHELAVRAWLPGRVSVD